MAISSVGYAGTVGASQWAGAVWRWGTSEYGVGSPADVRVTAGGGTRSVQVAAGDVWAFGVQASLSSVETVAFSEPPSGVRWDLLVARFTWGTGATTLEVIQGGSEKLMPSRTVTPGTTVDAPLALVRVVAGESSVAEVVDLRIVAANGLVGFDDMVLTFLNRVGTRIRIKGVEWMRQVNSLGSAEWVRADAITVGGAPCIATAGWELSLARARRVGSVECLDLTVKRTGPAIAVPSSGDIVNQTIATFSPGWGPVADHRFALAGADSGPVAQGYVTSNGVVLAAVTSGTSIATGTTFSLMATYLRPQA